MLKFSHENSNSWKISESNNALPVEKALVTHDQNFKLLKWCFENFKQNVSKQDDFFPRMSFSLIALMHVEH